MVKCPECNSEVIYRDGLRYLAKGNTVQRFLCRDCGFRFSNNPYKECQTNENHQLCVILKEAKKLDSQTETKTVAGVSTIDGQEIKGKIIEYLWYMKKQGYAETTVQTYVLILKLLIKRGGDIFDPESIEKVVA